MPLTEGLQLPFGIQLVNPLPVNTWEGPWDSIVEALATIPIGVRYPTMEVRILDSINGNKKYWFKDDVTDDSLVEFGINPSFLTGETQERINADNNLQNQITGLTAENISYSNDNYPNVKLALDKLLYVPISVNFTGGSVNEIGSIINTILNWSFNKDVISQSLNGNSIDVIIRSYEYDNITGNTSFSLSASDGTNTVTSTQSVLLKYLKFWGATSLPVNSDSTTNRATVISSNPSFQNISSGSFQIQTGNSSNVFWVLLPPGIHMISCLDTTANAIIIFSDNGDYIIKDAGETDRIYTLYSVTLGQSFSTSHNWTINTMID